MTTAVDELRRTADLPATTRSVAVLATGLLAGAVLSVWLVQGALGNSAALYIGFHQAADPVYTRVLPPLGIIGLIATLVALRTGWWQVRARLLTLAALGCLVLGLVVTVAVHFPINADLLTWSAADPPADWEASRDRWTAAHAVRTVSTVAAFVLLLAASRAGTAADTRR